MKNIDIQMLSETYLVKRLNENDVDLIFNFCKENTQYYKYCGKDISVELIKQDIFVTPPGIPLEQKYYVGFFQGEVLIAIMDLIDGYPKEDCAYIGFFMMNRSMQGKNIGSQIIKDVFAYLRLLDFSMCMLGIDKDNPQSNHFWKKNGFEVIREVKQEQGIILVAQAQL